VSLRQALEQFLDGLARGPDLAQIAGASLDASGAPDALKASARLAIDEWLTPA